MEESAAFNLEEEALREEANSTLGWKGEGKGLRVYQEMEV